MHMIKMDALNIEEQKRLGVLRKNMAKLRTWGFWIYGTLDL